MKPPIRLALGTFLLDSEPCTAQFACEALRPEYPGERQLTPNALEDHLQALKAVGIARIDKEYLDENGKLIQLYTLSEYGRKRVTAFL